MANAGRGTTRYSQLIVRVFFDNYSDGATRVEFDREELIAAAEKIGIALPKNLGDVIYSVRYRTPMPDQIVETAPDGLVWVIRGTGPGRYRFECVPLAFIEPTGGFAITKIPDSTPGIIETYRQSDEQALLAKLRYNRLIDLFLGLTCYSLQNHLRTTVPDMGQVETDEVYMGLDKRGAHYVVPVQAKGGADKLSTVQIEQDFELCAHRFAEAICVPVAAQFMGDDKIALFSFEMQNGHPAIGQERHYRLVPSSDLSADEIAEYGRRPSD